MAARSIRKGIPLCTLLRLRPVIITFLSGADSRRSWHTTFFSVASFVFLWLPNISLSAHRFVLESFVRSDWICARMNFGSHLFSARLYHLAAEYCHRATAQSSAPLPLCTLFHWANRRWRLVCRVSAVSRPIDLSSGGRPLHLAAFVDALSTCYRPSPARDSNIAHVVWRWIVLSDRETARRGG